MPHDQNGTTKSGDPLWVRMTAGYLLSLVGTTCSYTLGAWVLAISIRQNSPSQASGDGLTELLELLGGVLAMVSITVLIVGGPVLGVVFGALILGPLHAIACGLRNPYIASFLFYLPALVLTPLLAIGVARDWASLVFIAMLPIPLLLLFLLVSSPLLSSVVAPPADTESGSLETWIRDRIRMMR